MFKQLFATMNDVLDDILRDYPSASGPEKQEMEEQLAVLKTMSDACMEEWLKFEEKMSGLAVPPKPEGTPSCAESKSERFRKGQGYYKLNMFERSIGEFGIVVKEQPDFLLARLYLAMGYMRLGNYDEAYRHFQFLLPLMEHYQLKAVICNLMGCIQAYKLNPEKAFDYFKKAYLADPGSMAGENVVFPGSWQG